MIQFLNAQEMKDMIYPDSYKTAMRQLSGNVESRLNQWIERHPYHFDPMVYDVLMLSADSRDYRVATDRENFIASMFANNPELFWQFLLDEGMIALPRLWQNQRITLEQALQRLTPITPPRNIAFALENGYNNDNYRNAIKLLQEQLHLETTGFYDKKTAACLYRAKANRISRRQGYFAHEVNPNLFFDNRYEPSVYGVDFMLWHQLGFPYQAFARDDSQYWQGRYIPVLETGSEIAGLGASMSGRTLEGLEYSKKATSDLLNNEQNKGMVKTYGTLGKFFERLGQIFKLLTPVEDYLSEAGSYRGELVCDFSINAIEVVASEVIADKLADQAIKMAMTLVFVNGGTITFILVGIAIDVVLGELIDKAIEELEEFMVEQVFTRMKELITPYEEKLIELHQKDLEAGIRMD